jgi:hypothetical protein
MHCIPGVSRNIGLAVCFALLFSFFGGFTFDFGLSLVEYLPAPGVAGSIRRGFPDFGFASFCVA